MDCSSWCWNIFDHLIHGLCFRSPLSVPITWAGGVDEFDLIAFTCSSPSAGQVFKETEDAAVTKDCDPVAPVPPPSHTDGFLQVVTSRARLVVW